MAICIFCDNDRPLTQEHLFPDWLRQALPPAVKSTYTRRKGGGTINSWRSFSHNTTARIACQPCNTGWMSQIEGEAGALLLPKILQAAPGVITPPQAATIATWLYLKSLVIQSTTAPAVTPAHFYHDLFANRSPRPGTTVWLGALNGVDAATGFFVGAQIDAVHHGQAFSGYLATLAVGNLAARLLYIPPDAGQVGEITNLGFEGRLVKISPNAGNVQWPPPAMDIPAYTTFNATLPVVPIA